MTHYSKELKQKVINDMSSPNPLLSPKLITKYKSLNKHFIIGASEL